MTRRLHLEIDDFESCTTDEVVLFATTLLELRGLRVTGGTVAKALPAPREEFETWYVRQLEAETNFSFVRARDQMMEVLMRWLGQQDSPLGQAPLATLQRIVFDLSSAVSLDLAGLAPPTDLRVRLLALGFTPQEITAFPSTAWRFGAMRRTLEGRAAGAATWPELLTAAQTLPLARVEVEAISYAMKYAAERLRPIFLADGRIISDAALAAERAWVRGRVAGAMVERIDPLTLARAAWVERRAEGFRDWERVMRTEIAESYAVGAFTHEVERGHFGTGDEVYRIPRAQACKICLALYTNPDGSIRIYRVADLVNETTPLVDIGVRVPRLYRATIGTAHPHCLCPPWTKVHARLGLPPVLLARAATYRTFRAAARLEVAEAA